MRRETSQLNLIVRSTIFNMIFYPLSIIYTLALIAFYWLPRKKLLKLSSYYFEIVKVLEKYIIGLTYEVIGKEHVPEGGFILAMKHQSVWETLKVMDIVDDPVMIYKKALNWIPGFGWIIMRLDMISIDRSKGSTALKKIIRKSKVRLADGRQIVIFPQGTRVPVGEKRPYKYGVAAIYDATDVPVVPVAINGGLFWPKGSYLKYPGKATIKILRPIQPGLAPATMLHNLEIMIEIESNKL